MNTFTKSPLNYIGGKYKILNQLFPLFPANINCFVDLFAGGGNVGVNVDAQSVILNDNLTYLIDFYRALQKESKNDIIAHISDRIKEFDLSLTNTEGYNKLRVLYNKARNPLDLFVLVCYSFNHQIRFNNNHDFNTSFGKDRSCYNQKIEGNLIQFIDKIQQPKVKLMSLSFEDFDFSSLSGGDFVYCDPPYLITTGSYNDGKRGFKGWGIHEEKTLLEKLDYLNCKQIRFALSNVIVHMGKTNHILKNWIDSHSAYNINDINIDYSNANYQLKCREKESTHEVLITNYLKTS